MPPTLETGALASVTGLGIALMLEEAPFIIDVAADAGAIAVLLLLRMGRGGVGVEDVAGLRLPIAGAATGALDPAAKAGLLDKKFCTCCSCASENDRSCSSIPP